MVVTRGVLASLILLGAVAASCVTAGAASESCSSLKAQYKAGFSSLVGEVRQKSPALLLRYAALVGTGVPSKSEALGALTEIKPACVESLGESECSRLLARARTFINASHRLNAAYDDARCPGRIDG
jgi:hypothetical protein